MNLDKFSRALGYRHFKAIITVTYNLISLHWLYCILESLGEISSGICIFLARGLNLISMYQ